MSDIESPLRQAEADAEKLSAVLRVFIFATLAAALSTTARPAELGGSAGVLIALYGVGALIGVLLAWRGIFHPVIPYLFVTFDVALLAAEVLMLTRMMGMQFTSAFSVPAAALIFVILIHASMRFRPWLIIYAAVLFASLVEAGGQYFAVSGLRPLHDTMPMMHSNMSGLLNFQILPIVVIGLSALTLFLIGRRTRRLLVRSLDHAARTARLSRFFSPNLAARLADQEPDGVLKGRRQPVAVLFVDIRGFTTLGETMAPEDLGAFLSDYRLRLTEPVFRHGGTVDKFIGDAIMAVFGSPLQRDDDAERAVRCALDILVAAELWSTERQAAGQPPIAIGIGAHYGEVFAGAVGGEQLLEYTVIGDTVNVAERLERLSREIDTGLVVSRALLQAAGVSADEAKWRTLPPQALKGHRQAVEALCLT